MSLNVQSKRNINSVLIFITVTSLTTVTFAVLIQGFLLIPIINHFIFGLIFGLIISVLEIYFLEKKFRRLKFSTSVILRSLLYIFIFIGILLLILKINMGLEHNDTFQEKVKKFGTFTNFMESKSFFVMLAVGVLMIFTINFIRQINRLMGQNVLLNYVTGKYQLPLEEELIFMFLDLKSSTTIAERIGLEKNHELLNDFFYDMTDSILECKGRIYQYVGDEIVITWRMKDGINNLNCIKCFFKIKNRIAGKKDQYMKKFDVFPEFKAGLHFGKVITGEIGDIKKDIVYHGDTVNTSSRIQYECNGFGKSFLISETLLKKMNLKEEYKTESMGKIKLRGKSEELELYSIEEN